MSNKDTIIEALTNQLRLEREGNLALTLRLDVERKKSSALKKRVEKLCQALTQWQCPLKKPDCKENCGSYGCGN